MKHKLICPVVIFATAIAFILIAFGVEMFTGKASKTFELFMHNDVAVDVVILTPNMYTKKQWEQIEDIITPLIKASNDITQLNEQLPNLLEMKGYPVIGFLISKQVEVIVLE